MYIELRYNCVHGLCMVTYQFYNGFFCFMTVLGLGWSTMRMVYTSRIKPTIG